MKTKIHQILTNSELYNLISIERKIDETGAVELDVVKIEHSLKSTSAVINFYNTTCRIMINGQAYIDVAVDKYQKCY